MLARYWPCRGIFVGTHKALKADAVRNLGAFMASHTITTFLDGDDIAGPQASLQFDCNQLVQDCIMIYECVTSVLVSVAALLKG
jgi:hypothetical protein